jgi:galactokinase
MSRSDPGRLAQIFQERVGAEPAGVWSAPGRVNLIGEHTDYNEGHVLPFAVGQRTTAAVGFRHDRIVRVVSLQQQDAVECAVDDLAQATGWSAYVLGTVWALGQAGLPLGGFDIVVDGNLALGGGLSSSAALECSVALALNDLCGGERTDGPLSRLELARAGQRAENDVVGAPVGLMDQAASMLCIAGSALLLDCRSTATEQIPLEPENADLQLVVADTRVHHDLADGQYAARRSECRQAAELLGIPALRDVTPEQLDDAAARLEPVLLRRARHVVTEQARVQDAVVALRDGDWPALGRLLSASHASLRDDYEVSVPELDGAVDAAEGAGALGARVTGGGFGGNIVALVPASLVSRVTEAVQDRAGRAGWPAPTVGVVAPSDGAARER